MAIFDVLNIGRSGLLAQQRALKTNGDNIANVNTPGYTRQRTIMTSVPESGGYGVQVTGVEQVVDEFLETRLQGQTSTSAETSTRRDVLDAVQSLFPVGDTSIGSALQAFFASANQVATSPEDVSARTDLLNRAEALATQIRGAAQGLAATQRENDGRLASGVSDANGLLGTIAQLNQGIVQTEANGGDANALRDQRRQALGQLAGLLGVRTTEQADGSVDVATTSGVSLVSGADAKTLAGKPSATLGLDGNALTDIGVVAPDGSLIPLGSNPGGELGARLALRDGDLPGTASDLDLLATTLRDSVNAVQTNAAGRDLDGLVGSALFAGTGASDLSVALTDPRGIAAAQSTVSGDNSNALALVAVGSATQGALSGSTLGDYFGTVQTKVGVAARAADDSATVQDNLLASVTAQRDAVSGVTLEDEFTDLIRFQRGFQASAQLITVGDQLLQDVLAMVQ